MPKVYQERNFQEKDVRLHFGLLLEYQFKAIGKNLSLKMLHFSIT